MFNSILNSIEKIDEYVTRLEKFLACFTLLFMLLLSSLQVFLRNFFDTGIGWADVFVRHLVLFLLFFGASFSTKNKTHIQMDISSKIIPKKYKHAVTLVVNSICIFVTFWLFRSAWIFMVNEKNFGSILFEKLPTWIIIAIMPIGFFIIFFRFILNWIETLAIILGYRQPKIEETTFAA